MGPSDCRWLEVRQSYETHAWLVIIEVPQTFKVEQDVGLVVLEHLCNKLYVHVLDVDLLFK
jgi:hypothetical protein